MHLYILTQDFSNILVVDGLPKAPLSKFDKLNAFVSKIFGNVSGSTCDAAEHDRCANDAMPPYFFASLC